MPIRKQKYDTYVERIIGWNKDRFNQEETKPEELYELANEELHELHNALTEIEKLDAIGDIAFIVIGAFWRLGYEEKVLIRLFGSSLALSDYIMIAQEIHYERCSKITDYFIQSLAFEAQTELSYLGYDKYFGDLMNIICDSNETKILPLLPGDPQAKNKGPNYIPPTYAIKQFIKKHDNK